MAGRKSGFVRFRRRRPRKTYGNGGAPFTVFKVVTVATLCDVRERMRLAQRKVGLDDSALAAKIGLSKQAFCQIWRRRSMSEAIFSEIERALSVGRDYWTAPIDVPKRVPPAARVRQMVDELGRTV